MNNRFLLVIFLILICIILFLQWSSNHIKKSNSNVQVNLSGEENLSKEWSMKKLEGKRKFHVKSSNQMASFILEKITGKNYPPEKLAIGKNLYEKYFSKFGRLVEQENFFDLSSVIGFNFQIIVADKKDVFKITEDRDYTPIYTILENDKLFSETKKFVKETMKPRHDKIKEILGIFPQTWNYLYLPKKMKLKNIIGKKTSLGMRYNLATNEKDFEIFIDRLSEKTKNQKNSF